MAARGLAAGSRFIELANEVNHQMPRYVVRRLIVALNRIGIAVRGARFILLGMSYKPNTGDVRESPAHVVARELLDLGADVRIGDPLADGSSLDPRLAAVTLTAAELAAADAVVLLTDHDSFDYELIASSSRYVLDCRGRFDSGRNIERL